MKILITGGAGFIGSNLVERLIKGNEVIVLDNLSTGKEENIKEFLGNKNFKFINGSITDLNLLRKMTCDVDYILHHAAIVSVTESIENPILTNEVNINGTLNVLTAAKENQIKKLVFASSCAVYGDSPKLPKTENMNPNSKSPYAVTKLTGEYYCNVFKNIYGLETLSLRYFNCYGPRQSQESEYAAVIPKFIFAALNDKPIVIYGDGRQTRDFVYVKDVVNANMLAIKNGSGIYNIGFGKEVTINELADKIIELAKSKSEIIHKKQREGDIKHSLADISKAKKEICYEPKYNLEQGLKETVRWFKNFK